jgi:hypothetical protein
VPLGREQLSSVTFYDGRFQKLEAPFFCVQICLESEREGHIACAVANVKTGQNGNRPVLKDPFYNAVDLFYRAATLKSSQHHSGHVIKMTSQVELRQHAIDAVRGLSSVFQEKDVPLKDRLKGGAQKVRECGQVSPDDRA